MSRSVETCRGGQNYSFGNTQDILNISIGSVFEHELDEEPVIMRDETQFSDEGLTDGEWKKHLLLEELIGSMFSAKVRVFSNSMFCTSPRALDPTMLQKVVKRKQKQKRHCRSVNWH